MYSETFTFFHLSIYHISTSTVDLFNMDTGRCSIYIDFLFHKDFFIIVLLLLHFDVYDLMWM